MKMIVLNCPHCDCEIIIFENEINCAIFRHGIYKSNFEQMNPHATEKECNDLVDGHLIYGCGLPFRLLKVDDKYVCEKCDYI